MEFDPAEKAIEYFGKIQSMINKDIGEVLRARARTLPGMIESVGLVPSLSFCYGKATNKTFEKVKKAWECWPNSKIEVKKEEGGYAIYLLLSLLYLKDLGIISNEEIKEPIKVFKKILTKESITARLLMPYLIEVKRLVEAVYGE